MSEVIYSGITAAPLRRPTDFMVNGDFTRAVEAVRRANRKVSRRLRLLAIKYLPSSEGSDL